MARHVGGLQADDRPRPLPLVKEDQLQPLKGEPQPGDVLSYRLLEIGEDFSPQVCRTLPVSTLYSTRQSAGEQSSCCTALDHAVC